MNADITSLDAFREARQRVSITDRAEGTTGGVQPSITPTTDSLAVHVKITVGEDRALRISTSEAEFVDTARLYDRESSIEIARFVVVCDEVLADLRRCRAELVAGQRFAADDSFMRAKGRLPELFMFRGISDSVGTVVLACIDTSQKVRVISDAELLLSDFEAALKKLRERPLMEYAEARSLSRTIRAHGDAQSLPAYDEILKLLLPSEEDTRDLVERASGGHD